MSSLEKAGHLSDVIGCSIAVADIRLVQGRLREAMSTYERGLQHASDQGAPPLRGVADMHVGLSLLLREGNDLEAAMQHLAALGLRSTGVTAHSAHELHQSHVGLST